jgi:hypothetical protein
MIKESIILSMAEKSTLFFNYKNLEREAKCNPTKMVQLLKNFKDNRILIPGLKQKLVGSSFLLNPNALLNDKSTDILYICQYLSLAAKRDYSLYSLYGVKHLLLSYFPDLLGLDSIRTNPLLVTTNQTIHFKYED